MKRFIRYLATAALAMTVAGCASLSDNVIHVSDTEKPNPNAIKNKYPVSIRIAGYVDGRNAGDSHRIGKRETRVIGLSGPDIIVDRDVSDIVEASLKHRLSDFGIQVMGKDDSAALFELTGTIKDLKYDVKARDQVYIKLETTLKEIATGKVVWAGEVEQKDERFAGVSGNSKSDIAEYLKQQVGVVSGKTAEAVNSVLMATRPELFNLIPGTKAIPGVRVLVTPNVAAPAQPAAVPAAVPAVEEKVQPTAVSGVLVVNTEPGRAKIYVDGVYFGLSPLRAEAAAGVHKIEAKLKGYKTASEKVSVRKGDSTELELTLVR